MRRLLLVCLALLALPAPSAEAGGFSNPDFGIRRLGMFSVVARPDDVTAIYHNPAGMTLLEGTHLYHAQSWFFMTIGIRMYDSQGVLRPEKNITPDWSVGAIPFLGVVTDFGTKKLRGGLAVYAPNAYGAAMPADKPTRYHATRALFLASRATAAIAYKITDRFSAALAVNLINVYVTASRMMNALVLADPDARFAPYDEMKTSDAELKIGGMAWTWALDAGLLFHPTDTLSLGFSFGGGSDIAMDGDVRLTYPDGSVETTNHHTQMVIPFTLRAGLNWRFAPDFEWGADIYYWHYQVLQEQRTVLDEPIMGMTGFVDPKDFGNSWSWNTGLMYHVLDNVEVMVGWQMDFSPIPDRTFSLDNASRDQNGLSLGARWALDEHWRVGAAFVRNWVSVINVQDSIGTPPTNAKGFAANSEFGFDVNYKF